MEIFHSSAALTGSDAAPGRVPSHSARRLAFANRAAVVLLFTALGLALATRVTDSDFWWHLASGRWMWEHRDLLRQDPFGIPLDFGDPPGRREFVLQQQWLAQIVFHAVHALAGLRGIILLRAALLVTMFALAYRRLRGLGAPPWLAAALVGAVANVFIVELGYVGDRPQLWTSLFLVVLLEVLDRAWRGERAAAWGLPALMIIWANLHAGFVVGAAIAALYALARIGSLRTNPRPFAFVAVAILVTGLNPCGFRAVTEALGTSVDAHSPYWRTIVEWQSLLDHATPAGIARRFPALTALVALGLVGLAIHLARPRAIRPERLALALLATVIGVRAIRFVPFLGVVAAETAALGLAPLAGRAAEAIKARAARGAMSAAAVLAVLVIASQFAVLGWRTTAVASDRPYEASLDPAVRFIRDSGLEGNLFNDHNDGGFVLNALAPRIRVFIDGRALSMRSYELYRLAVDSPEVPASFVPGLPTYKGVLAVANANPVGSRQQDQVSGTLVRLTEVLLRDTEWAVVYADERAILFARRSGVLAEFTRSHALPRSAGYDNMLAMALAAARRSGHAGQMPNWKLPVAIALARRGETTEALALLQQYLDAIPDDPLALAYRGKIWSASER